MILCGSPLAVFTPYIGLPSETFVRRHLEALLPRRTVAVAKHVVENPFWVPERGLFTIENPPPLPLRRFRRTLPEPESIEGKVASFLRAHRVKTVLFEFLDFSLPWFRLAKSLGLRCIAHGHGYDVSRRLAEPEMREGYLEYNSADRIVVVSEHSRGRLVDIGLDPSLISVVPCGVDVPRRPRRRDEGREVVKCLAVGRMVPKKGLQHTIRAFARAHGECPRLRLDVVGTGSMLEHLTGLIAELGMEELVTLHGALPHADVHALMRSSDIFLHHAVIDPLNQDEEGLPVALLEAMSHALPVVSTWHAGIPDAVRDGQSGYLCPERDEDTMAERILQLASSPSLREALGKAGWRTARERFSWNRERSKLRKMLRV